MEQTFGESLLSSGVGFLIVFIGLVCLIALVTLMGQVFAKTQKKAPAAAAPASEAPAASVAPVADEIPDRDELVAVLSAAVAEELGTDVSAIRVVSLREIR